MPSPNDTIIGGTNGSIIDSAGNVWTINSGGQVAVDGAVDTTTKNVIELAYTNGTILQENSSQLWWAKTQPNASWTPSGGPLPPAPSPALPPGVTYLPGVGGPTGETAISGPTGSIMDTASNKWTITTGGQVAVNGVADTTTKNVIELVYINGTIWQENNAAAWWTETQPNASWVPAAPPPPMPIPTFFMQSPDGSVVRGATGSIVNSYGNAWTITTGGQIAVDGTVDTTTKNVIELAWVNGTIWQENSNHLWWGETQPNASWAPAAGTSTSPLPPALTPALPPGPSSDETGNGALAGETGISGPAGSIIDASGNTWTITTGGQVAVNGAPDTTTKNVIELAYVNGTIWLENSSRLWWGETQPSPSWTLPPHSPDGTVIKDASGSLVDSAGNTWTITTGGQVAVNGAIDTTTKNFLELEYVYDAVWQENSSHQWWEENRRTGPGCPQLARYRFRRRRRRRLFS
jgi:sugar lactone lactonase YvrE